MFRALSNAFVLFLCLAGVLLMTTGCDLFTSVPTADEPAYNVGDWGPGASPTIDLPFAAGQSRLCTQGAGGSYSHQGTSTQHGLDLDTSNTDNESVFAPVSGIAYVHDAYNPGGFGFHVNIDVGDGQFVTLGHLSEILIDDGEPVLAGQFIGYEGCTGNCSGDHIHLGLMAGVASDPARFGTSLPVDVVSRDTSGGEMGSRSSEDFVCGVPDGHRYESNLDIVGWHPDGSLLMTTQSPDVWVIDGPRRHLIDNESVFWSYGWDFDQVLIVSEEELGCYLLGTTITQGTCYRAVRDSLGALWMGFECANNPGRYRQHLPESAAWEVMASWGVEEDHNYTVSEGQEILSYPVRSGDALLRDGTVVTDSDGDHVYVVNDGVALEVENTAVLRALGIRDSQILELPPGTLRDTVLLVRECSGSQCVDEDLIRNCGLSLDAEDLGASDQGGQPNPDPCRVDDDFDTVANCDDNCPQDFNTNQDDLDGDGLGDVCDEDADDDGFLVDVDCDDLDWSVGLCDEDETPPVDLDEDNDGFDAPLDCDDTDDLVFPGAAERCNGIDDNCDQSVPVNEQDLDFDGYAGCDGDCVDADDTIYPGAFELCDGLDNDCDQSVDEGSDIDMDGVTLCQGDCNDLDNDIYPGAVELCGDGVDQNCDGLELVCLDEGNNEADETEDDSTSETMTSVLEITYQPPSLLAPYTYIDLSGEYTLAGGGFGFLWTSGLATAVNASSLTFDLPGVMSGDTLRFSVEYYDAPTNYLNWGCVPTVPFAIQGNLEVFVDGQPVPITLTPNGLGGCEHTVTVP